LAGIYLRDINSQLIQIKSLQIDFWRPPPNVNSTADVMVDTENGGIEFLNFLARHKMEAKILVDDLSKYFYVLFKFRDL